MGENVEKKKPVVFSTYPKNIGGILRRNATYRGHKIGLLDSDVTPEKISSGDVFLVELDGDKFVEGVVYHAVLLGDSIIDGKLEHVYYVESLNLIVHEKMIIKKESVPSQLKTEKPEVEDMTESQEVMHITRPIKKSKLEEEYEKYCTFGQDEYDYTTRDTDVNVVELHEDVDKSQKCPKQRSEYEERYFDEHGCYPDGGLGYNYDGTERDDPVDVNSRKEYEEYYGKAGFNQFTHPEEKKSDTMSLAETKEFLKQIRKDVEHVASTNSNIVIPTDKKERETFFKASAYEAAMLWFEQMTTTQGAKSPPPTVEYDHTKERKNPDPYL